MKKIVALLLALCLLTAGCAGRQETPDAPPADDQTTAGQPPEQQTQAETEAPETTAPQPELESYTVMADGIPVIRCFLEEGASVEVTGYDTEALARVKTGQGEGVVDTRFLAFPGEEFTGFTGYAKWNAKLYKSFVLLGEPLETLKTNTQVEVLADLEDCYYVEVQGQRGCIAASQLRMSAASQTQKDGGSGGTGSRDGRDISLMAQLVPLADSVKTGAAGVKLSGVPLIIRRCSLGQTVQVVITPGFAEPIDGYAIIQEPDGSFAYLPECWLQREGLPAEPETGYAGSGCKLYDNEILSGKAVKTLNVNTKLQVLWKTEDVAFIQVGEQTGFVPASSLRDKPVSTTAPGSGSGSGGSGGGGGLWTPPKL